jgi:hypothetical protein
VECCPIYFPGKAILGREIGHGVVGGNAATFESIGDAVAGLALDALAGKPIVDVEIPHTFFADARQLKRWDLSEDALPPETALSFQQPNIWENIGRLRSPRIASHCHHRATR